MILIFTFRALRISRIAVPILCLLLGLAARAASPWEEPAGQLAGQIVDILGAGQAQLVVTNRSTIAAAEVPRIRRLLEESLRSQGVVTSGAESANAIRITLSENARERVWVAEVVEGNTTQVTMVQLSRETAMATAAEAGMILEKKRVWNSVESGLRSDEPVLAAFESASALVVLEREEIVIFTRANAGWHEQKRLSLNQRRALSRDSRGLLLPYSGGDGFVAFASGMECSGFYDPNPGSGASDWTVTCKPSDDPWPIPSLVPKDPAATVTSGTRAFYNAARNYFTGVLTPEPGIDLPPFYSIATLPRPKPNPPAYLLNSLDGKVLIAEAGALRPVAGTRDWGSDFAAVRSGCGTGMQILASSSGEAASDSLRAFELPAQEAVAVSAPLEMGGAVTALWTADDGASALAVVRKSESEYEVDRVSALCP